MGISLSAVVDRVIEAVSTIIVASQIFTLFPGLIGVEISPQQSGNAPISRRQVEQTQVVESTPEFNFGLTCSGDHATTSRPDFTLPHPVFLDSYSDWNLYVDKDNADEKYGLSFAYPSSWEVIATPNEIRIRPTEGQRATGADNRREILVTRGNGSIYKFGDWLRGCFNTKNTLSIGDKMLNQNQSLHALHVGSAVMYLVHNLSDNTFYVYRGEGNINANITRLNQEQLSDQTTLNILSSFSFSSRLPFSTSSTPYGGHIFGGRYHDTINTSPDGKYEAVTRSIEDGVQTFITDSTGTITKGYFGRFLSWESDSSKITVQADGTLGGGLGVKYYVAVPRTVTE